MSDYNLFTLAVVDDHHRVLGMITVDDVLDNVIPEDWCRREPPTPADDIGQAHRADTHHEHG